MGAFCWKTASLLGNHGMHLIIQPVHVLPCSNLAMKGNNGTNRILYHDIAAQTITEPLLCFTFGTRRSRLLASLGVLETQTLPNVGNSVKGESSDHNTHVFSVVWCPGFMVSWAPPLTHLSITFSKQRFSNCCPTMDAGFVNLMSDSSLRIRRHRLDALFLTRVYFGFKFCPSVLEIVGFRVPARYIRDYALFNICSSCKNCPSARCVSAANVVCRDVDVFATRNIRLNNFL
jgi:hypothetical protein